MSLKELIQDTLETIILLIKQPKRKTLNKSKMGVNCFFNKPEFGTQQEQGTEIANVLGVSSVRILLHWDDAIQPSESSPINWSFIDGAVNAAQGQVLMIVGGAPSWVQTFGSWGGRKKYINFFEQVCERYKDNEKVVAFQVGNEPNNTQADNIFYEYINSPKNYVETLSECYRVGRTILRKDQLIVNAATTSVMQGFPDIKKYNEKLLDLGAQDHVDVWAIHIYGDSYWRVTLPFWGIGSEIKRVHKPIWVTEIGIEGLHNQLEYAERTIPFFEEKFSNIDRFFWYQYGSDYHHHNFGLKQSGGPDVISDMFVWLRNN